jgi:hypothetical protein
MKLRANTQWGELGKTMDSISNKGKQASTKELDERFFVPGKDSDGNIAAVIRFLPSPDSPAVLVESKHFIKGISGKVYGEDCPKSHGKYCPACSWIGKAWGDGDKASYKKWGAKDKYVSNILVINDLNNSENNGNVFLYKYGKTIYNMIDAKVNPTDEIDSPSIVFDYMEGENFKLVGTPSSFNNGSKDINFDDFKRSEFKGKSKLGETAKIEKADSALHSMSEWLPENKLKSFDDLKVILDGVVNDSSVNGTPVTNNALSINKVEDESAADEAAINALIDKKDVVEPAVDDITARLSSIRQEM